MKVYGKVADSVNKMIEEIKQLDEKDFDINSIAQKFGLNVTFEPIEIAIGGYISNNKIVLNSNLNTIENKGTFLHELSHFVLGHSKIISYDSENKKEKIEQEAETLTYLVCKLLGIERQSLFYLKAWNTNEEIKHSIFKISNAFSKIKKEIINEVV